MGTTDAETRQMYRKKMAEATDPLEKLRNACLSRGVTGIKSLGRAFRLFDDDGSKSLNLEEFTEGLRDYGVTELTPDQIKQLFATFDKDGSGTLHFDEFLMQLTPPMNKTRLAILDKAFAKADKTGDGVFTTEDLKGVYKATNHPKYMSGEWDQSQVYLAFLANFDGDDKDGKVTKKEFLEYYASVSASIDNDAYFDLTIRNAWGL